MELACVEVSQQTTSLLIKELAGMLTAMGGVTASQCQLSEN